MLILDNDTKPKETYIYIDDLTEAIRDTRERQNLIGPFDSAEDAIKSMLEGDNV